MIVTYNTIQDALRIYEYDNEGNLAYNVFGLYGDFWLYEGMKRARSLENLAFIRKMVKNQPDVIMIHDDGDM